MDDGNLHRASFDPGSTFMVTLRLTVEDNDALWRAAADRASAAQGTRPVDVRETIGPREDPGIESCISMVVVPAGISGCAIDDFEVRDFFILATGEPGATTPVGSGGHRLRAV